MSDRTYVRYNVKYKNNKYGYINKTGKTVIPPQFDFAGYFSKGLAGVELNGQWYLIDKTGKKID